MTALGGLPVYLDLIKASGLDGAIKKYVRVAGEQGWLDLQMILALIVLNLAGGWRIWSGWNRTPALPR